MRDSEKLYFDYQRIHVKGFQRPLCDLFLIGSKGKIMLKALIDSGADYSVFKIKDAEDAGVNIKDGEITHIQFGVLKSEGYRKKVYISLNGFLLRTDVVFVEHLSLPYVLLGRIGVFARFN
ncbi:MAG: hypothetical protein AB1546_05300, partial [bacterium]